MALIRETIVFGLVLFGTLLLLLAAVGVVRMPDLFTRMQTATKASTLGVGCLLLAAAIHFSEIGIGTRAVATICFFFLTAPVTAHLIARASYVVGTPLWEKTRVDELWEHRERIGQPDNGEPAPGDTPDTGGETTDRPDRTRPPEKNR